MTEDNLATPINSISAPEPGDISNELQSHTTSSSNSDTANAPLCAAALPRLCVVQVKVRGQIFKALTDSGSQVNLVSEAVLEQTGLLSAMKRKNIIQFNSGRIQ